MRHFAEFLVSAHRDPRQNANPNGPRELADSARNELQKFVLLLEVNKLNAGRCARLLALSDSLIAESRALCEGTRKLLDQCQNTTRARER
jgi:hypothetical protein